MPEDSGPDAIVENQCSVPLLGREQTKTIAY